ncbi:hypothetical protein [Lysinibacillus sp. NPDC093692]|uniref:hypothetical protein n=1 Tax=Lysinibacillus sp. NPDC093692 TaxID=3390578 RepID=UPI003CFC8710
MTYFGFVISREDEANFPHFSNVTEARAYFQKRYGDRYNLGSRERQFDGYWGGYIYFDDVDGQPVQIGEDGSVHVVY